MYSADLKSSFKWHFLSLNVLLNFMLFAAIPSGSFCNDLLIVFSVFKTVLECFNYEATQTEEQIQNSVEQTQYLLQKETLRMIVYTIAWGKYKISSLAQTLRNCWDSGPSFKCIFVNRKLVKIKKNLFGTSLHRMIECLKLRIKENLPSWATNEKNLSLSMLNSIQGQGATSTSGSWPPFLLSFSSSVSQL